MKIAQEKLDYNMGPFSYEKQLQRAEAIEALLKDNNLKKEAKEMWTRILGRLAFNEEDYNARVMYVYKDFPKDRLIKDV